MRLAIMQPYLLPYIGYFQLIGAVDEFVVYDNIKYTKKGWINRNRMLQNGTDVMFSVPLKSGSDTLNVREREVAPDFNATKLLNQFKGAYQRAPHFEQTFPLIERVIRYGERNLFAYLHHAITAVCDHLAIRTPVRVSSTIGIDHDLKAQDKVLAICRELGATTYINAIGGLELYDRAAFAAAGIDLKFIQSRPFTYPQFGGEFQPWLSILDVLMFNPTEAVQHAISENFDLV
jgi:hypothetical protein